MARQVAALVLLSYLKAVSSKGCFLGSALVKMVDGRQRRLDQVQVGDEVLSWDEGSQQTVPSIVMHVPKFQRFRREVVTLSLPHAQVHTTEDHPFWSRGRRLLVSMQPNDTAAEYGLQAEAMQVGEMLESPSLKSVEVLNISRLASATSPEAVEVATLCLHPFHWFYVHGVRVHNKGCFAPWVRVLMSDGSHKRISDVREQDRVMSWDSDLGQLSEATVEGLDSFPPRDLFQVRFDAAVSDSPMELATVPQSGDVALPGPLVMTADHPVYSSRVNGLVSMRPNQTHELYGLSAMQMQETEILRHHSGDDVEVRVQPWNGKSDIPFVMTLRLDQHHWFYAEGVRVHNKGGHGGHFGGFHGGGHYGARSRIWTHSHAMNARAYAALVILSSRRRYGTWYNTPSDYCQVKDIYAMQAPPGTPGQVGAVPAPGATGATPILADGGPQPANASQQPGKYLNGTMALDNLCTQTVGFYDRCSACNSCSDDKCVDSIGGCDKFLREVYSKCASHPTTDWKQMLITLGIFCFGGGCCLCFGKMQTSSFGQSRPEGTGGGSPQLPALRQKRTELVSANGANLLGTLMFTGTYSELGETKPTAYNLRMEASGAFTGQGRDDDGVADVRGVMRWLEGSSNGHIMWSETRPGASMEVDGEIIAVPTGEIVIRAKYASSTGVVGKLNLQALGVGGGME